MSWGRMAIHRGRYGEGNGDLLMHLWECVSIELAPVTRTEVALDGGSDVKHLLPALSAASPG